MQNCASVAFRWVTLTALCALYALLAAGVVHAQDRHDRALALAVAKVAANEFSLVRVTPAGVALIAQVAESHGETSRERLAWLRRHSRAVLGDRVARGNSVWSRNLSDSDTRPDGWPTSLPWARFVQRWRNVRRVALLLVTGELVIRPCASAPWTWGSVRLDRDRAIARGLVPLGCVDPFTGEPLGNDGFALQSRGAS